MALFFFRLVLGILFLGLLFAIVVLCMDETYREHVSMLQNCLIFISYVLALPVACLLFFLFDSDMPGFWDRAVFYMVCGLYVLLEVLILAKKSRF